MKSKLILLAITLSFAALLHAQRPAPDSAILEKLREIVALRERIAKNHERLVQAGRAPADASAEIELAEARIALAQENGHRELLIAAHKELVAAHEQRLTRLSALSADRFPPEDLDRARANLLQAEIRLLRAQK